MPTGRINWKMHAILAGYIMSFNIKEKIIVFFDLPLVFFTALKLYQVFLQKTFKFSLVRKQDGLQPSSEHRYIYPVKKEILMKQSNTFLQLRTHFYSVF